ncbi:MBL fold metallo-hydrolase [Natrinema gelatinilyticum]|uniref:MBL fold metallo-hydrolase n=1 Tax=Natrinema gelatinilyticum TaxID=2961571 RepID=UPI0020C2FBED|nr:MBL fold metallo-hydrolase [Natrinema gelatinilyticum]
MVHSTWGTWFVQDEVEAATVDGFSIWYLGCNGFVLRTAETTVYIDPYFADGDPPNIVRMIPVPMDPVDARECDAVLVTHEHIDHMHPPSFEPLVTDLGADVYAPRAAYEQPDYDGPVDVPKDSARTITDGETFTVGDLTVHVRGANDPDAIEPVTFVVEHDAGTFFHGGDSRPAESFAEIGDSFDIDLGVLALGSVGNIYDPDDDEMRLTEWYMNENQVIEAANALQLTRLFPSHWDMWRGVGTDPKVLHEHAASYEYPRTIDCGKIGDRLDVARPGIVPAGQLRSSRR